MFLNLVILMILNITIFDGISYFTIFNVECRISVLYPVPFPLPTKSICNINYFNLNPKLELSFYFRFFSILVSINLGIRKSNYSGVWCAVSIQVALKIDLNFRVWSIFFKSIPNFVRAYAMETFEKLFFVTSYFVTSHNATIETNNGIYLFEELSRGLYSVLLLDQKITFLILFCYFLCC